ncbi:archaellin/type IV pilin N-terminal domain-containing protein [Halobaculum rarum]|uniref:archaellin/type IV pilin N-terminal domain-containing protein n=1 Tax=Halobaculum rarum TaxID=3075122 RepID=UPI0032AEBD77
MFEFITDEEARGQVGIGTLIVFIAMVLVAAIAAGVLINTAGFLQSKSQETGQQSSKQVSDRVQEVATVGNVSGEAVDFVNVTVTQGAGAGEIDLQNTTVTWIGPSGTYQLIAAEKFNNTSAATGDTFTYDVVKDGDSSAPVLNDNDDRLQYIFDVDQFTDGRELGEGEEVTIKINTMAGATTEIRFSVPESLGNKEAVEL